MNYEKKRTGVHNITGYFDIYFLYQADRPFWSGQFIMPLKQTSNVLLSGWK